MHHYPEDQSDENLKKLRRNNVCAECGRTLYVYLDLESKQSYIACPDPKHEGIAREYKLKEGFDYQTEVRRSMKLEKQVGHEGTTALAHIPKQGQLTKPQAIEILSLVYPNATNDEIIRTAIFCRDFGLHPLANEVYLIPFKGKNVMVVGIPANRKIAHALKGQFSFLDDTPRVASEEEITKQFGPDSEEAKLNIISVTKLEGEGGNKAIGFGLWARGEHPYGMDKGNTQRNMANIRSERQAMDRLPGKALPKYEVMDASLFDVPDVGKVNKETGEIEEPILEGEAKELPPEAPPEAETEAEPEASASLVNLDWLKETLAELQNRGIKSYSNESMLDYIQKIYKMDGTDLYKMASRLDKGKAAHLCKMLQDALDKS